MEGILAPPPWPTRPGSSAPSKICATKRRAGVGKARLAMEKKAGRTPPASPSRSAKASSKNWKTAGAKWAPLREDLVEQYQKDIRQLEEEKLEGARHKHQILVQRHNPRAKTQGRTDSHPKSREQATPLPASSSLKPASTRMEAFRRHRQLRAQGQPSRMSSTSCERDERRRSRNRGPQERD